MSILKNGFYVQMHYKAGVISLSLAEKEAIHPRVIIHTYEKAVDSFEEAFRTYKAYLIFAEKYGYRAAVNYFANAFDVDTKGKSLNQIIQDLNTVTQKIIKEIETDEKC